jgi:hypothetical protein
MRAHTHTITTHTCGVQYPLSKEQPRAQTKPNNPSKNTTKSSIEVVARVVELLEQNMTSLTTLSWCLSVTQCSSQLLRGMGWDIGVWRPSFPSSLVAF